MKTKSELAWMSATELAYLIRTRKLSPVEVMTETFERIERINPQINAFVTLVPELAMARARKAEEAVMKGQPLGPLHGVPVAIKDLTPTRGIRTTMGSKLMADVVPDRDAVCVQRIKGAGAIIVGKTNTPEFGHRGTTSNLLFPETRNPWNLDRTPGGSSGGSAAAVAAGLVPIAEGSDGGGSVRIPAAFCGTYGFKPTYGSIPSDILNPYTSDLLHFGTLARSVTDGALLYQVMAGDHPIDPYSRRQDNNVLDGLELGIDGLRVAYSADLGYVEIEPQVRAACDRVAQLFKVLGCTVDEVDPGFENPQENIMGAWEKLWMGLISGGFGDAPPEVLAMLDPMVQDFIAGGMKMSAFELTRANLAREMVWKKMQAVHEKYDVLICATTAVSAFELGISPGPTHVNSKEVNPLLEWALTYQFNLTGHPVAAVPIGFTEDGLPLSLQIVGRRFEDALVHRVARALERIAPWDQHRPTIS